MFVTIGLSGVFHLQKFLTSAKKDCDRNISVKLFVCTLATNLVMVLDTSAL